ncbi:MAG TPA: YkgJ family cysteine cluster protein [Chitinophagaceae bacterium]|nr:YkgJ family cysteine cluster protein [Chitinophagaceae bacterium]
MEVVKESHRLKPLFRFLNRLKRNPPRNLQNIALKAGGNVWHGIDCLSCANCCKTMTPTYTAKDIKKIASYLQISTAEMKRKWLKKERGTGNWLNKTTPCQFLDLETNMCNVYEARPADCAGFPHLTKKRIVDYIHIHKQNLDECPATFRLVEKMNELVNKGIGN